MEHTTVDRLFGGYCRCYAAEAFNQIWAVVCKIDMFLEADILDRCNGCGERMKPHMSFMVRMSGAGAYGDFCPPCLMRAWYEAVEIVTPIEAEMEILNGDVR